MRFQLSVLFSALLLANVASAATAIDLRHQPLSSVRNIAGVQLKQARVDVDFNQTSHARMQQMFGKYRVWNATSVIHTPKANSRGLKESVNGIVYQGLELDLVKANSAMLSDAQQQKALKYAKEQYRRDNRLPESIKFNKEAAEVVVYVDDKMQAHYAFHVTFYHDDYRTGAHRPNYMIDAVSFKALKNWDQVMYAKIPMPAANQSEPENIMLVGGVGGNEKVGPRFYDGQAGHLPAIEMKLYKSNVRNNRDSLEAINYCVLSNEAIEVRDAGFDNSVIATYCGLYSEHPGVYWVSMDRDGTSWKDDEMNGGNSPSLDAFYGANIVNKMYHEWYGVSPLVDAEGNSMRMIMRTHYGRKFDNAFWDGEQMTFGDGDRLFYPLTSLDVTAHEISHGFTQLHSNIDYTQPQMGALHESFSDMAAAAAQYYATGEQVWALARDIWKNDGAMRYMDNPRKDGKSIDHMKDFDETEAHAGGGITNKAFYLIATSKGWDTHKAFNIMVKANMNYWTSSMTTLSEAACGVISATQDYGYNPAAVHVAFSKVGIDTTGC